MFEEFFGLATKPFGKTPDPGFLYESPQHKEALARLEYAVEEKELALLVGDIGSGKTMLSRALIDRIGEERPVVLLINPRLTPTQLLKQIARGMGIEPARFRNDILDQIHTRLYELYEEKREPVLKTIAAIAGATEIGESDLFLMVAVGPVDRSLWGKSALRAQAVVR